MVLVSSDTLVAEIHSSHLMFNFVWGKSQNILLNLVLIGFYKVQIKNLIISPFSLYILLVIKRRNNYIEKNKSTKLSLLFHSYTFNNESIIKIYSLSFHFSIISTKTHSDFHNPTFLSSAFFIFPFSQLNKVSRQT